MREREAGERGREGGRRLTWTRAPTGLNLGPTGIKKVGID